MSTTTLVKNARTLVASGTSNSAGGATRGTLDLRTAHGGGLTFKMTNGATGPTVQCVCNILVANTSGATPAAASAGDDWKLIASIGGGVTANAVTSSDFIPISPGVMHLEVEFTGNTVQAVTVEAFFSEITSVQTT